MELQIMLSAVDPYILLAIGVALIALEALIVSFILIWFGIGFIIVALISYFFIFSGAVWQLAIVSLISLFLILILRKKVLEKFLKSKMEISDDFFNEKGIGEIKNSKVFYKGTYWEIDSKLDEKKFKEGEKVVVLKTSRNSATIEKK
ncbi:MAG: nodulation efficiency protein D [Arcobacter sp.]|jgi:membrane protein implicated in regulation of membrane protease activity|uniref:NfeD family protein n=1 Tax=Arcobacter sp. TaxID=1872629 RepID=UPI002A763F1F|nr:nodulation efficiency protein D [Arcobacter sp.]MDY3200975.1 nodulation efficiency protein D [Arcobacter sp.]